MVETTYAKGLEGVIAAESTICQIDGANGRLYYRGYPIEELARYSNFEETTYLLLYERLPCREELEDFSHRMRASRELKPPVKEMIRHFPEAGSPMELLQSVIAWLSGTVEHQIKHSATCNCRRTLHQVAQMLPVLGTYQRFKEGKSLLESREDLSHGANFLYLLRGEEPSPLEGRIMDTCLVLHAEHGFNASTFTSRVVASTFSTCYCSVSAAIGALAGFLHGGANERVMDAVDEIGSIDNIGSWLDKTLGAHEKVMGMGHRVYKTTDPRATIMEGMLQELSDEKGDHRLYDLLKAIEESFRVHMEGKPLYPNVDFFSGAVYTMLGIPRYLFTPIFAAARSPGWLAHILEQRKDNKLYRPRSLYTGPAPREYVSIEEREQAMSPSAA
jgi:citrate synthase